MSSSVARARRPEVLGGLGGFAGLFRLDVARYRRPVLATATDGVGTKIDVARRMGVHDTIGIDLVAMCVDDLVVVGAEPLFMTDYIATGKVVPERVAAIVSGVAEGCRRAGCALIGGETAEHPGLMAADDYDVAGAATGVVEEDAVLGPQRVRAGDVLVAMAASGLHSNGYSLARHVVFDRAGWDVGRHVADLGRTIGEELLEPTRIYALDCLALAEAGLAHAFAHVTGGGLAANLARVLPDDVDAVLDRSTWALPPVFGLLARLGDVPRDDAERTFNQGVGMVAVVPGDRADAALALLAGRGVPAWVIGSTVPGHGRADVVGEHR
jgi:phosphoribosylformylglycinamidine cyclo-ligase